MEVSGVPSLCGSWSTVGQQLGGVLGGTAWGMCCRRALWLAVTWFDVLVIFPLEWGSGRLKWGWLTILVFYVSRIGIVLSWFSLTTTVGYQWGGDRFVATVWGEKKKVLTVQNCTLQILLCCLGNFTSSVTCALRVAFKKAAYCLPSSI